MGRHRYACLLRKREKAGKLELKALLRDEVLGDVGGVTDGGMSPGGKGVIAFAKSAGRKGTM